MKILGIDPGIAKVGYGLILAENNSRKIIDFNIVIKGKSSYNDFLIKLYRTLDRLFVMHKPSAVAIESVFLAKNPGVAIKLGEVKGVVRICALRRKIPAYEYATRDIKRSITGYGNSDKSQVQKMLFSLVSNANILFDKLKTYDISDAIAVALCHELRVGSELLK
jgi:crossover junction endodeoxyribonuclease RuvC